MKPKQLCEVLNRFLVDGLAEDIFDNVQHHNLETRNGKSFLAPVKQIGMLSNGGISVVEYAELLDNGAYSAVFMDGSIISIETTFRDGNVESHRYFFIPSPFDQKMLMSRSAHIPLADWIKDSIELEGVEKFRSVGTFRFDCVRLHEGPLQAPHPVSHMTFGSVDCRIPVKGPLSIAYFLHFVFDNFYRPYRAFWLNYSSHLTSSKTEITITEEELLQHHLNWNEF